VRLTLIAVPYDLGRADVGSGRGPAAYLQAGVAEALRARGHDVNVVTARRSTPFANELQAVLDVNHAVAIGVAKATLAGALPIVLAGNCNAALGAHAGLHHARGGGPAPVVIWLDAHGDFNTPATTHTGYLDGMPLAMLCGRAHREAIAETLGAPPQPESLVVHIGARELDGGEAIALDASGIHMVAGGDVRRLGACVALTPILDRLAAIARSRCPGQSSPEPEAHLHIDLDVLDPHAAPGVTFPTPGGLSLAQLLETIACVKERYRLVAVTVASYTPDRDDGSRTALAAGLDVLTQVAGEVS